MTKQKPSSWQETLNNRLWSFVDYEPPKGYEPNPSIPEKQLTPEQYLEVPEEVINTVGRRSYVKLLAHLVNLGIKYAKHGNDRFYLYIPTSVQRNKKGYHQPNPLGTKWLRYDVPMDCYRDVGGNPSYPIAKRMHVMQRTLGLKGLEEKLEYAIELEKRAKVAEQKLVELNFQDTPPTDEAIQYAQRVIQETTEAFKNYQKEITAIGTNNIKSYEWLKQYLKTKQLDYEKSFFPNPELVKAMSWFSVGVLAHFNYVLKCKDERRKAYHAKAKASFENAKADLERLVAL